MSSPAATVTGSAVRGSASTATAGAATLPWTDIYRRKLHCLSRQTDANIISHSYKHHQPTIPVIAAYLKRLFKVKENGIFSFVL